MSPLCRREDSALLCLDLQQQRLDGIQEPSRGRLLTHAITLIRAADLLQIPVATTERYPQGLGSLPEGIRVSLPATTRQFVTTQPGCGQRSEVLAALRETHKRQLVLCGLEAHLEVLQTALELQSDGFEVFVVDDAVCSKRVAHWKSALDRLRQAGVIVAPTESILSEWLREAGSSQFEQVQALLP